MITSSLKQDARSVRKMKPAQLSDFCRQLGTLLGAGVSLVRALNIIAQDQNLKPGPKKVYEDVLRLIRQASRCPMRWNSSRRVSGAFDQHDPFCRGQRKPGIRLPSAWRSISTRITVSTAR